MSGMIILKTLVVKTLVLKGQVLKGVGSDQQRKPNAGQERRVHLVWPMGWSIFVKGGGKVT